MIKMEEKYFVLGFVKMEGYTVEVCDSIPEVVEVMRRFIDCEHTRVIKGKEVVPKISYHFTEESE